MLEDIIYDPLFLTFEVDEETNTDPITSFSFDEGNYDFTPGSTSSGGEVSIVFIS